MVQIERFTDPVVFLARAEPFLMQREAQHNLLLGLSRQLIDWPDRYPTYYLAAIVHEDHVVGVALMTPPYPMQLSDMSQVGLLNATLSLVMDDLLDWTSHVGGFGGPPEPVMSCAELWKTRTSQNFAVSMRQGIYKLEQVIPVSGVPGRLRRAVEADRPLLTEWLIAFEIEALGAVETDADRLQAMLDRRLADLDSALYLWEDGGQVVSMAGVGGPTPNGIRIGAVYTPPAYRQRGYASACVAALSQLILDTGRRFCFLYTDLANPTSNRIYQQIGYEHVSHVIVLRAIAEDTARDL